LAILALKRTQHCEDHHWLCLHSEVGALLKLGLRSCSRPIPRVSSALSVG